MNPGSLWVLPARPCGWSGSGLARICGQYALWMYHGGTENTEALRIELCGLRSNTPGPGMSLGSLKNLRALRVSVVPFVVHVGEVARSSAALALALCRAGPGFPSMRLNRYRYVVHESRLLGQSGPAPSVNSRWQFLPSRNKSQNRKPARSGFLCRKQRNPVERALSLNRPLLKWTGGTGYWPHWLPWKREHHAPARAQSPGVGKVLRKVSSEPPRVNLSKRADRNVKPRRADSRTPVRTR